MIEGGDHHQRSRFGCRTRGPADHSMCPKCNTSKRTFQRKLNLSPCRIDIWVSKSVPLEGRKMAMTEHERRQALGRWGEGKALVLLKDAGFTSVRDINAETHNHPFGDIYAELRQARFVTGVKTRNKYQQRGDLNAS